MQRGDIATRRKMDQGLPEIAPTKVVKANVAVGVFGTIAPVDNSVSLLALR